MSEITNPKSIYCDIVNCAYNDDHCHCNAPGIEVRSVTNQCTASCSEETACATFRPKSPYKAGYDAIL